GEARVSKDEGGPEFQANRGLQSNEAHAVIAPGRKAGGTMSDGRQPLDVFDRNIVPALGVIAAVLLFGLMVLTCVDVVGRYFLNRPVYGAFEITEMLLAALIFLGLPLVTLRNEHVNVDVLDPITPDWLFRLEH